MPRLFRVKPCYLGAYIMNTCTKHPYLPAPYLYLPHIAARVRRTGFRATVAYFKNQGYTLDQALYLFAGRNTLTYTGA